MAAGAGTRAGAGAGTGAQEEEEKVKEKKAFIETGLMQKIYFAIGFALHSFLIYSRALQVKNCNPLIEAAGGGVFKSAISSISGCRCGCGCGYGFGYGCG